MAKRKRTAAKKVSFDPKTILIASILFALVGTATLMMASAAPKNGKGNSKNKTEVTGTVEPQEITAPDSVRVQASGLLPDASLDNDLRTAVGVVESFDCGNVSNTGTLVSDHATVNENGELDIDLYIESNAVPERYNECYDVRVTQVDRSKKRARLLVNELIDTFYVSNGS